MTAAPTAPREVPRTTRTTTPTERSSSLSPSRQGAVTLTLGLVGPPVPNRPRPMHTDDRLIRLLDDLTEELRRLNENIEGQREREVKAVHERHR